MCWRLDFPRGRKNAVAGCLCCLFVNYFVRRTQEEEKEGRKGERGRSVAGPNPDPDRAQAPSPKPCAFFPLRRLYSDRSNHHRWISLTLDERASEAPESALGLLGSRRSSSRHALLKARPHRLGVGLPLSSSPSPSLRYPLSRRAGLGRGEGGSARPRPALSRVMVPLVRPNPGPIVHAFDLPETISSISRSKARLQRDTTPQVLFLALTSRIWLSCRERRPPFRSAAQSLGD